MQLPAIQGETKFAPWKKHPYPYPAPESPKAAALHRK